MNNKNKKEKICNHNPQDKKNTLEKLNRRVMVNPCIDEYICKICHDFFDFEKK